jgi:hypothetical protein
MNLGGNDEISSCFDVSEFRCVVFDRWLPEDQNFDITKIRNEVKKKS